MNSQLRIFSMDEVELLKEKMESLLSIKGVRIKHPKALKLLKSKGVEVLEEGGTVKFPPRIVEECLRQVPQSFVLAARDPRWDLAFPHPQELFYTRTNTGGLHYYSEKGESGPVTLEHVMEWTRLSQYLENIDFCSLPSTSSREVPGPTVDIHTLKVVLENTTKHIWVQPYERASIPYLIELASVAAGGEKPLKQRPIISLICCSITPLEYKDMDMEVLLQGCAYGVPIQACSLPISGANVPITVTGTVLMACAEVLAIILMAQLMAPGTPVIATPLPFAMDMMSTATLQSSVEVTMARIACTQIFEQGYGIPAHTYGMGTDSFVTDEQAVLDTAFTAQAVALGGASILGGAGQIETAKTISPLQLIVDDEIAGMLKHFKRGLRVDDETMAWKEIVEMTGHEGFLAMDHTLRYFRELHRPRLLQRGIRTKWEEEGAKTMVENVRSLYHSIARELREREVDQALSREMAKVTAAADRELAGIVR